MDWNNYRFLIVNAFNVISECIGLYGLMHMHATMDVNTDIGTTRTGKY